MRTSRNTGCHEWQANSAIHRLNRQQSSHGRARLTSQFSFSNYPAFKRAFRQNKLPDPFRFENSTFTDFCISRQLSHFAAFFIDTWPEWSTVKSIHFSIIFSEHQSSYSKQKRWAETRVRFLTTARMQSKRSAQALAAYDKSNHTSLTVA